MSSENEQVNHPSHYGGDTQYECIKVLEAWQLNFHLGNTVKYIARAGKKSPDQLTDLRKALWYLNRYIVLLEAGEEAVSPTIAKKLKEQSEEFERQARALNENRSI